jgi:integrase
MPSKTGRPGISYRGVSVVWSDKRSRYEGKVTLGRRPDGTYDRRSVYGKTPDAIRSAIRELQEKADKKIPVAPGRKPTIRKWFDQWLTEVHQTLERPLAPRTVHAYLSACRTWIYPAIGDVVVDDLTIAHLDALYAKMRPHVAPGYLLKVHAIIRRGLALAMVRDLVHRNVAALRDNPGSTKGRRRRPLTVAQARQLVAAISQRPTALRWMVGLAIGPRQGEALGLTWPCVDLDAGTIARDWQLQRLPWRHGCADPPGCAAQFCRRQACTPSWAHGCADPARCYAQAWRCPDRTRSDRCPRHQRKCPPPCPPGCDRHAARCPQRVGGGLVLTRPKTWVEPDDDEVATDVVAIPATLVKRLRQHKRHQERLRKSLGDLYEDHGLVFCQPSGRPIDPRADLEDWHEILAAAGLPRSGTHVARHSAATMLLDAGQDIATVQRVMGWSDIRTARRYATPSAELARGAAQAAEDALFGPVVDLAARRRRKATG